jgi:hypothetical protein
LELEPLAAPVCADSGVVPTVTVMEGGPAGDDGGGPWEEVISCKRHASRPSPPLPVSMDLNSFNYFSDSHFVARLPHPVLCFRCHLLGHHEEDCTLVRVLRQRLPGYVPVPPCSRDDGLPPPPPCRANQPLPPASALLGPAASGVPPPSAVAPATSGFSPASARPPVAAGPGGSPTSSMGRGPLVLLNVVVPLGCTLAMAWSGMRRALRETHPPGCIGRDCRWHATFFSGRRRRSGCPSRL